MEEILQRMLEVEHQAEATVADAEKQAEGILETGRRDAAALRERLQSELSQEAKAMVAEAVAAAERRRAAALADADAELNRRTTALETALTERAALVRRALAYPAEPASSAAPAPGGDRNPRRRQTTTE